MLWFEAAPTLNGELLLSLDLVHAVWVNFLNPLKSQKFWLESGIAFLCPSPILEPYHVFNCFVIVWLDFLLELPQFFVKIFQPIFLGDDIPCKGSKLAGGG